MKDTSDIKYSKMIRWVRGWRAQKCWKWRQIEMKWRQVKILTVMVFGVIHVSLISRSFPWSPTGRWLSRLLCVKCVQNDFARCCVNYCSSRTSLTWCVKSKSWEQAGRARVVQICRNTDCVQDSRGREVGREGEVRPLLGESRGSRRPRRARRLQVGMPRKGELQDNGPENFCKSLRD